VGDPRRIDCQSPSPPSASANGSRHIRGPELFGCAWPRRIRTWQDCPEPEQSLILRIDSLRPKPPTGVWGHLPVRARGDGLQSPALDRVQL
jgi:hypothetical protein